MNIEMCGKLTYTNSSVSVKQDFMSVPRILDLTPLSLFVFFLKGHSNDDYILHLAIQFCVYCLTNSIRS